MTSNLPISASGPFCVSFTKPPGPRQPPYSRPRRTRTWYAASYTSVDHHISGEIADILNQRGLTSGTEEPFHRKMIDHIIHSYRLRSRRQRLRDAGMLTPAETAKQLGINLHTVKHWRRAGIVRGLCYNDKGEMLYHPPDPDNPPQRPKIGRPAKMR